MSENPDIVSPKLDTKTSQEEVHSSPNRHEDSKSPQSGRKSTKRRKTSLACVYCRRSHMTCDSERPCTRCIKRSIGHLCHDETRETPKKSKGDSGDGNLESINSPSSQSFASQVPLNHSNGSIDVASLQIPQSAANDSSQGIPRDLSTGGTRHSFGENGSAQYLGYEGWGQGQQGQSPDMLSYHPNYMFNNAEVTNEYNLLNDFLADSLIHDSYLDDESNAAMFDGSLTNTVGPMSTTQGAYAATSSSNHLHAPPQPADRDSSLSRTASSFLMTEKAKDQYYLTAADPAGSDTAEERMSKLLKAKYDAGMLKPFNYIKGYAKMGQYMEQHLRASSRQIILRQLEKFRPSFRERIQKLNDVELVKVEIWFERKLMEYDRVFASMAIPACCWRRSGEIFRGNRAMAELIRVPIEDLRDGKLAVHEIVAEDSLVTYWQKFVEIAFDPAQKAILTSCTLQSPRRQDGDLELKCCFSFTVQRDEYEIPGLIIGNFLPIPPEEKAT